MLILDRPAAIDVLQALGRTPGMPGWDVDDLLERLVQLVLLWPDEACIRDTITDSISEVFDLSTDQESALATVLQSIAVDLLEQLRSLELVDTVCSEDLEYLDHRQIAVYD